MLNVYKCVTTCTWDGRYWEEGTLTGPLSSDKIPPEHFKLVNDHQELEEALDKIDEEDEPMTYAELSAQINDAQFTGSGIVAGDINYMTLAQLKELAQKQGVYNSGLRTRQSLIDVIDQEQK